MFTIFDLFQLVLPVAGAVYGFIAGQAYLGLAGGVGGAIMGGVFGFFAGRLPFLLTMATFNRKSTQQLWKLLHDDQYFVFHLALPLLMARGEDVTSEKRRILDLLASDISDRRRFGWASLQIAFPLLAKQLPDFNPESPSELHIKHIEYLKSVSDETS